MFAHSVQNIFPCLCVCTFSACVWDTKETCIPRNHWYYEKSYDLEKHFNVMINVFQYLYVIKGI